MLCNGNAKCMTEGNSSGSDFLLRTKKVMEENMRDILKCS